MEPLVCRDGGDEPVTVGEVPEVAAVALEAVVVVEEAVVLADCADGYGMS